MKSLGGLWMRRSIAALAIAALPLTGCGRPALRPVDGIVTIGGVPAENVRVFFLPNRGKSTEGRQLGIGISDVAGRFDITSGSGAPGLEPGSYRVAFSRPLWKEKSIAPTQRPEGAVETIVPPYNDPETTPFIVDVPSPNGLNFDLPRPKEVLP